MACFSYSIKPKNFHQTDDDVLGFGTIGAHVSEKHWHLLLSVHGTTTQAAAATTTTTTIILTIMKTSNLTHQTGWSQY
jgi:hypothetical protein